MGFAARTEMLSHRAAEWRIMCARSGLIRNTTSAGLKTHANTFIKLEYCFLTFKITCKLLILIELTILYRVLKTTVCVVLFLLFGNNN